VRGSRCAGGAELAVDGDHAVGDDPLDRRTHQLDVRLAQALQPEPVILEDPLAHGRVVGDALLDQIGATFEV
jgi:hypothetical protein